MAKSCKKGSILRKGYSAKRGSKKVSVKAKCIKARSQTGLKRSSIDRKIIRKKASIHRQASKKFGTPKCPKGQMVRAGYKRTSKKTSKTSWAKPTCIKSVSARKQARTPLFVLNKGTLSSHGYHHELSTNGRHDALIKAMHAGVKPLTVYRKLKAVALVNKNTHANLSKIFARDAKWLKTTSEYINRE
jgi:hypothetical protein